jgi:transcriptional regulator with XRE-family HTH domain
MSLREFAEVVGCTAQYLSDIYSGKRPIAKTIMTYLGIQRKRQVIDSYVQIRAAK